jgi:hypothetical protein
MIPLNRVKIDSFRLLIPYEQVKILDDTFESNVVAKIYDTGIVEDLDDKQTKNTIFKTITGIKLRFAISKKFNEQGIQEKYLEVIVNAKMLKQEYFNGIDKTNIHKAFNFLNSTGIVEITKEVFLSAKVVDIDFCFDVYLKQTTCKDVVKTAYELTIAKKDVAVGIWNEKTNTGIQWSSRAGVKKAYTTKQFLKYYAKLMSLKYDPSNVEFYETYLKDIVFGKTLFSDLSEYENPLNDNNFLRIETTIKNSDHFETYKIKNIKTLEQLLQLNIASEYAFFKRPQSVYMTGYKILKQVSEQTHQDKAYYIMMNAFSQIYSIDIQDTIPFIVNEFYPYDSKQKNLKQSRSQLKKKLLTIALKNKAQIINLNNEKQLQKKIEFEKLNLIPKS